MIVQRRLTEYRVPLFDALRREIAADGIRLSLNNIRAPGEAVADVFDDPHSRARLVTGRIESLLRCALDRTVANFCEGLGRVLSVPRFRSNKGETPRKRRGAMAASNVEALSRS